MSTAETSTNRYLDGNYGPVADEVTAFDLRITGDLPAELSGRYLRNGPNPMHVDNPALHHWFVGDGMVHGVRLRDGAAEWYRNRYVGSRDVSSARGVGDIAGPNWSGSGTGPNTNVGGFAGRTWAMVEAGGTPVELTYELETIARNDFFGTLPGAFTAHPKVDPATGEMHAMAYAPTWMNTVQYIVVGADGHVRRTVDIELPDMVMLHDMALTERYAVVYDMPVTLNFDLLGQGRFPLRWNPDHGARLGLLPREGEAADITWIDVPQSYVFHPLNAYDRADGTLVIDQCVYTTMFDNDLNGPFGDGMARLERWELNPATRGCSVSVIDEEANEFPRLKGSLTAKEHRYGYCAKPSDDVADGWPTLKHDLVTGARGVFDHGPGRCAGEPVFISRQDAHEEDDGWIMTMVHDINDDAAELVVLDAQDFGRGYVAQVHLPQRVPFGFHGNWVSDRSVPPGE